MLAASTLRLRDQRGPEREREELARLAGGDGPQRHIPA
jgi:hypothetical protein